MFKTGCEITIKKGKYRLDWGEMLRFPRNKEEHAAQPFPIQHTEGSIGKDGRMQIQE